MRQLKISNSITNRDQTLGSYLTWIAKFPLLNIEEEIELAQKIKRGGTEGEKAREKLVTSNLRFVVSVAKQYQHQGLALSDLINEGNIGLMKAADKFDETRGFKFISYAVWWIRQSVLQAISEQGRMVRLPLNVEGVLHTIANATNDFMQKHQRLPSVDELAAITNVDPEKIGQVLKSHGPHTSIDAPLQSGEDTTIADTIQADSKWSPDKEADSTYARDDHREILLRHRLSRKGTGRDRRPVQSHPRARAPDTRALHPQAQRQRPGPHSRQVLGVGAHLIIYIAQGQTPCQHCSQGTTHRGWCPAACCPRQGCGWEELQRR